MSLPDANARGPRAAGRRRAYGRSVFVMAMDHRASLARDVYGIAGEVTAADAERISRGKRLAFDGLLAAIDRGADRAQAAMLVDERYGASVARRIRERGITLAMPIERSGQDFFVLEYGDDWMRHVEEFSPDHVKVLVRDNPGFDPAKRDKQRRDLAEVSARLRQAGRSFLFELLVPPTEAQQSDAYDADVRPELTIQVLAEFQRGGVEPDIWKIEGLETREAAEAVVRQAHDGGRGEVRCIVLGRDAPEDRLDHWLKVAAGVDGFDGFAIGRSIWEQALKDELAGKLDGEQAMNEIANKYLHFCRTYASAARG